MHPRKCLHYLELNFCSCGQVDPDDEDTQMALGHISFMSAVSPSFGRPPLAKDEDDDFPESVSALKSSTLALLLGESNLHPIFSGNKFETKQRR